MKAFNAIPLYDTHIVRYYQRSVGIQFLDLTQFIHNYVKHRVPLSYLRERGDNPRRVASLTLKWKAKTAKPSSMSLKKQIIIGNIMLGLPYD